MDSATNAEQNGIEHADDSDLPQCERLQFAQYIMSALGTLPEKNAKNAMMTIRMFLRQWPGYSAKSK